MTTKLELLEGCLPRYLKASKEDKGVILGELCAHTGLHRKAVIRALRRLQLSSAAVRTEHRHRGGRAVVYGPDVTPALKFVWELSFELCAERLRPVIGDYVRILRTDGQWPYPETPTMQLLKMSVGTMKRRIAHFQKTRLRTNSCTTRPSSIKVAIPVRHGPWENPLPGYGEIDTVVHCGTILAGDMAFTVNYTDIATTWFVARAQLNKGEVRTRESIGAMRAQLPFRMLGLDPDSGSEFINWHLKEWCDHESIELSRSRPYRKNDNAHIEQKNRCHVRDFLGYQRIAMPEQISLMNELYAGPLYGLINFFQPSMKLQSKERIGSRYRRVYDTPKTPLARVLEHPAITPEIKFALIQEYKTLNPLHLKKEIDRLTKQIAALRQVQKHDDSR